MLVLALTKIKPPIRLIIMSSILWIMIYLTKWDLFLFIAGMLLADISHHIPKITLIPHPTDSTTKPSENRNVLHSLMCFGARNHVLLLHFISIPLFLSSLFLLSWPIFNAKDTYGYKVLYKSAPRQFTVMAENQNSDEPIEHFWLAIGAVLLITSVAISPVPQGKLGYISQDSGDMSIVPEAGLEIYELNTERQRIPFLQLVFTTKPAQFLGKISYSF